MRQNIGELRFYRVCIVLFVGLFAFFGCGEPQPDRVEVSPADKVIAIGDTIDFSAVVRAEDGKEIPDVQILWRVVGEAGTIDSNGRFSVSKPGNFEIIAESGDISGKATVEVTPVSLVSLEARPEKADGYPGTEMKLQIRGLSADDRPAGYHEVTVTSPTENLVLGSEKLTLSESGDAQVSLTLPPTPGDALVNLSAGGVEKQVKIQVVPRAIQKIVIAAEVDAATVESDVGVKITATDKDGQSAGYNDIALSTTAPDVTVADETLTLDGGGQAQTNVTLPAEPGRITITVAADNITQSVDISVTPRPVAQFKISVDRPQAITESEVGVSVQGLAADGKAAGFNTVDLKVASEGTRVSDDTLNLDKDGNARFTTTLSFTPGKNIVTIQSGRIEKDVILEGTQISRLTISPQEDAYEIGQRIGFKAVGHDAFGNSRSIVPKWSISGNNAAVTPEGTVTMEALGDGILLAKYEDLSVGQPFTIVPGKPARLDVTPATLGLKAGARAIFQGSVFNAQDLPISTQILWKVEGDIGNITADGTFTALRAGEGAVVATSGDATASVPIIVEHGDLVDILFDLENKVLTAGSVITLSAKGVDAFENKFDIAPQWLLTTSIGAINQQESLFSPLKTGTGEIIAKVGNVLKGVGIEIVPAELSRLEMTPPTINMIAGETVQFQVSGYDRFGNNIEVQPEFMISDDIGDLTKSGKLIVRKAGNAIITAEVDNKTAKSSVAVSPAQMESAAITPEGPLAFVAGTAQVLNLSGFDAFGNTVTSSKRWEIQPELGIIDENGVVHPEKVGKGNIIGSITQLQTGKTLEVVREFTVAPGETTRIDVTPNPAKIVAGEEVNFSAASYDHFGNDTNVKIVWQAENPDLGTIDADGRFRGVRALAGKLLAIHGNVVGSAAVEVVPAEVSFLKIIPENISIEAGQAVKLEAIIEDKFGNVVDGNPLWQLSDDTLAKRSTENVLTGQRTGTGRVVGIFYNLVATVPLEIKTGPLHVIELKPSEQQLTAGSTFQFKAMGFDAGGNPVASDFDWSMEAPIGQIDSTGKLMAEKAGTGKVEVRANDITAAATISVVPGAPAAIVLEPEQINTTAGESQQITFDVYDAFENLISNADYLWTIENNLGTVSAQNVFTARSAGTGNIHLTVGKISAKIDVTVVPSEIETVRVEPAMMTLKAGDRHAFSATGFDAQGNRLDIEPVWSVNGGIGRIGADGVFQGTTVGRGYVLVRMESATGVAEISVEPGPADRIAVFPEHVDMNAGDTARFTATVYDAFGNVVSGKLMWSLSGESTLGSLSSEAVFKAQKTGQGHVVASLNSVSGRASVKILPGKLMEIIALTKEIVLASGQQSQIETYGLDEFGNRLSIEPSFQILPEELGKIESEKSLFTSEKAGSGRIKASVEAVTAEIPIRVEAGALSSMAIQLPESEFMAGKTYALTAIGYDPGKNIIPVSSRWAVSQDIGTIDAKTGLFNAKKAGNGMLIAYSGDIMTTEIIEVKPGDLYSLFLNPNPVAVKSDTLQPFQVNGFDVEENRLQLSQSAVDWDVIGDTGLIEKPGIFRATRLGKGKVVARTGNLLAEAYVTVVPGEPETANCRIRVMHPTLPAGGDSFSDVIVEVRDKYHNPVPGITVTLVSSRQTDEIIQPEATKENGMSRGRVSSRQKGGSIIRGVIAGTSFSDTAVVEFE
ncbi:MAG: hypothetical protein PVI42_12675 [Desulfobacterales bacterium]|jgi:hypothetical protein